MKIEKAKQPTNTWCDNPDGKGWNVDKAEKQIMSIHQHINFFRGKAELQEAWDTVYRKIYKNDELRKAVKNAVKEMADILDNKDNESGYHINHIESGKIAYCVFSTEGDKSYKTDGVEYPDQETAEAEAAKHEDAYAEEIERDEGPRAWLVWTFDEEGTRYMKEQGCGHYIAEFDTIEEAEAEAAEHENGYVEEMPSEEWFAVINNKTGRRAYDMLFPSEIRALAFLYKAAAPAAWMKYLNALKTVKGGK